MRDERLISAFRALNDQSSEKLQRTIEQALSANTLNLQALTEVAQARCIETVRSAINQLLVPALDTLCARLFQVIRSIMSSQLELIALLFAYMLKVNFLNIVINYS